MQARNVRPKDVPSGQALDTSVAKSASILPKRRNIGMLAVLVLLVSVTYFLELQTVRSEWPKGAEPVSSRERKENRKIFVDLGANCGNTYLKRKKLFDTDEGPPWEVYLWEPSPQMHKFFLNDLARENPSIVILPYAAGVDSKKELQLYVHKGQEHVTDLKQFRDKGSCSPNSPYNPSGGSTIFQQAKVAGDSVTIQQLNFPKWLAQMKINEGDRFIFKIDIEGAELDIMDQMLSKKIKDSSICMAEVIEMEFHKNIFEKWSKEFVQHEEFENNFENRFLEKCGRQPNLVKLS
jgi:FkbM family methyltransferase